MKAVKKPIEPDHLDSLTIRDLVGVCRDEDCGIEGLHAAHPPQIRRGPKIRKPMRSV